MVDYLLVRVNKDNSLSVIDKETKLPLNGSEKTIQRFVADEQVMVYGSKTFANIAKEMKLEPGSFMNEQFEFEVFRKALGNELLNPEFIIGELFALKPIANEFFIRPTGNTKLFTGMTVTKEEFYLWQEREKQMKNSPYIGQPLMISPLQTIQAEYRFFVVNEKIITSSSYKVESHTDISRKPSTNLIEYAKRIVNGFPLAKAFVVDIAETDNGFKVIEYNNINTSGLYGCDETAFVRAINQLTK